MSKISLEKQADILAKLNVRALKIAEIEEHFRKVKVPIDLKYLDTLKDEQIDEIYKNHCSE